MEPVTDPTELLSNSIEIYKELIKHNYCMTMHLVLLSQDINIDELKHHIKEHSLIPVKDQVLYKNFSTKGGAENKEGNLYLKELRDDQSLRDLKITDNSSIILLSKVRQRRYGLVISYESDMQQQESRRRKWIHRTMETSMPNVDSLHSLVSSKSLSKLEDLP